MDFLSLMLENAIKNKDIYSILLKKLKNAVAAAAKDPIFIDAIERPGDEVRFIDSEELTKFMEYESKLANNLFRELIREKK